MAAAVASRTLLAEFGERQPIRAERERLPGGEPHGAVLHECPDAGRQASSWHSLNLSGDAARDINKAYNRRN